ncbi:MAG: type II toxin-antitoxin system PemK/MazF family toxin [Bacteroidia bacterium]
MKQLNMAIRQFEIWLANLNPQKGTEPGKIRPVLVIQTNFLNKVLHPSTLICPITTNIDDELTIIRVNLTKGMAGLDENCDILIDQIRAIDNKRMLKKIGDLPPQLEKIIKENLIMVLNLD